MSFVLAFYDDLFSNKVRVDEVPPTGSLEIMLTEVLLHFLR